MALDLSVISAPGVFRSGLKMRISDLEWLVILIGKAKCFYDASGCLKYESNLTIKYY